MANEILSIPEEHVVEVAGIIRSGLVNVGRVTPDVRIALEKWCREEIAYIERGESNAKNT